MQTWGRKSQLTDHYEYDDCRTYLPRICIVDVLMDYKQFKAARTMQRHLRGWLCRRRFYRQQAAATTIARWWRGYSDRKTHFISIPEILQRTLMVHFDRQAIIIQALYRGWRNRLFIHDVQALHTMQLNASQDVINCIAYKLHHLMGEKKLPGIYSMRATDCHSKVEELLSTLVLRFLNGRVHARNAERRHYLLHARKDFMNSYYQTYAPFGGPSGLCDNADDEIQANKVIDVYMARVVTLYEEARRDLRIQRSRKAASIKRKMVHRHTQSVINEQKFCHDIFDRIQRWKGLDKILGVKKSKTKTNTMEDFLDALNELLKDKASSCYCKLGLIKEELCR